MTDISSLTEEEQAEWWLFLKANPIGVDPNILNPEDISKLPENVRKTLWDDKTSSLIYLLGYENGLDEEKISDIARIVRQIALGEISSSQLTNVLRDRLGVSDTVAQKISSKLTTEIIAPNYFQISQLYEKKQKAKNGGGLSGRPIESLQREGNKPTNSPQPKTTPPKNVIDLRKDNGGIPTKLPPTPPLMPKP